jgi:SAM-dependent methyltransferase
MVINFGCGAGHQALEIASNGAAQVIGLEIQDHLLEEAKRNAEELGLGERCVFRKTTDEKADIILSKDAFEHFENPGEILEIMSSTLKPDGYVLASFGPTWLHPYGGHLFSVFPWSHLLFTEKAQIRWRSDFKNDGATRFSEVAGGLNQLTISKFEKIVDASPFFIEWMETVPIKGIALFRTKLLREIGSSIVRCKLRLKNL